MIDSRSARNFIDHATTLKMQIPLSTHNNAVCISMIDGGPIRKGIIQKCTQPLRMYVCQLPIQRDHFSSFHRHPKTPYVSHGCRHITSTSHSLKGKSLSVQITVSYIVSYILSYQYLPPPLKVQRFIPMYRF